MIEYLLSISLIGYLIYYLLRKKVLLNKYELPLYIFIYGLFSTYLLSIVLLIVGLYSEEMIRLIIRILAIISIIIIIRELFILRWKNLFVNVRERIIILILVMVSVGSILVVFNRPNEFVLHSSLDSSNYVIQAGYINKTGKYYMTQEYKDEISVNKANKKTNFESYGVKHKSILVDGEKRREMPFYILNKVSLANAMSFSDVKEVLYLPLVFLILNFLAIVCLSEKILKKSYLSILVGLLFSITPAVINNARSTMTELITLLIIIIFLNQNLGKFNQEINEECTKNYNDYIGIVLFSMLFLTRSDAIIILAGVMLAQNISLNYRMDTAKYRLLLVLSGIMGMTSYMINPNYSNYTVDVSIFENKNIYPYLLLAIVTIGFICEQINIVGKISILKNNLGRINSIILKIILPVYFLFCFIIRPLLYYIFNELGYIDLANIMNIYPGLCIITYFGGITFLACIFMLRKTKNTTKTELLEWGIYCFIPSSVVLAYNFMHSTHLYWASRRYIYSILPLFIITGIFMVKYISTKWRATVVIIAMLVQNLLLNYSVASINDVQSIHYVGLTRSLEQFVENIDSNKIGVYNDIDYAVPLVNYINNFTEKKAKIVNETDISSVLEDEEYTVIVQDLKEIYSNRSMQGNAQVSYDKIEYEDINDREEFSNTINYKLLFTYKNQEGEKVINKSSSSSKVMGYIDKSIQVNENTYFMQGWSHIEERNIKEIIVTDKENYIIGKTPLGEYRPGINEAINSQRADYVGWNLFFTRPNSESIKIYLDIDGNIVLFKEEKLSK